MLFRSPVVEGELRFLVDAQVAFKDAKQALLDRFEAMYLKALIEKHENNITRAGRTAGLTRYHLRELLKKHGLHGDDEG